MIKDVAIIIPTFNEIENILPIYQALKTTLDSFQWEAIFVDDDSPDGTARLVRDLAKKDSRIRCIQRLGRRGLSSACIEGIMSTSAKVCAVMDADLQHDIRILPQMLQSVMRGEIDLAIGSRYIEGGGTGTWKQSRVFISQTATNIGSLFLDSSVNDPMSGFFVTKHSVIEKYGPLLSERGFKILMDLLMVSKGNLRIKEFPYEMKPRALGTSKLDVMVSLEFIKLILDKTLGKIIPVDFILFVSMGFLGAILHLSLLGMGLNLLNWSFFYSQGLALFCAMTLNFTLNNNITYRDSMLKGHLFFAGLVKFYIACSLGFIVSLNVATFIFDYNVPWFISGLLGAVMASVWNFSVTKTMIWDKNKQKAKDFSMYHQEAQEVHQLIEIQQT